VSVNDQAQRSGEGSQGEGSVECGIRLALRDTTQQGPAQPPAGEHVRSRVKARPGRGKRRRPRRARRPFRRRPPAHRPSPGTAFAPTGTWRPLDETLSPMDPLEFTDQKSYPDRVRDSQEKTGMQDALRSGTGEDGVGAVGAGTRSRGHAGRWAGSGAGVAVAGSWVSAPLRRVQALLQRGRCGRAECFRNGLRQACKMAT
jgi:hypothetical protein